ncbi:hypothetical protein DPEC_G00036090 [Dallia pectoralis]|uniref:Uncharacterized protein n=1 Tax=Dallia pectoralis TaxID=75939 RepID=A0ACC2HE50_DALPE|nr:hypothetical protein DPEC_G00036090 [Dallia pectoralis]
MEFSIHSVFLLASISLYCLLLSAEVGHGQYVPGRCECYETMKRVKGKLSDLKVIPKSHTCNTDQIIVMVKTQQVCVDPTGRLGKQLLRCWQKVKARNGNMKRCLVKTKIKQNNQGQNRQNRQTNTKPKRQPKQNRRRTTPIPA